MLKSKWLKIVLFICMFMVFQLYANNDLRSLGGYAEHLKYGYAHSGLDWRGWLTIIILAVTFITLASEMLPPDIVLLAGAMMLLLTGILNSRDFLKGFSRDVIFVLAMLFIISRVLDLNGILNFIAKNFFSRAKSYTRQLFSMMFPLSIFSAFLNNTPIVLMLTPIVRRWSIENGRSPSKFLIPLSYAAILGGMCTLIGTSHNLVVDGLLRQKYQGSGLGFFELAKIGLPCAIAGLLYMLFIGKKFLPDRVTPTSDVEEKTRDFTGEFEVGEDCPLIGKTIEEASEDFFSNEFLVEIERRGFIIESPQASDKIFQGDRLVFAGDIKEIAKLHSISGMNSLADPHFKLNMASSHFAEVIIANTSTLIGKTLVGVKFRSRYGASVLAIYRQGKRFTRCVGTVSLRPGDTLIVLSNDPWHRGDDYNNDFFFMRDVERLPILVPRRAIWILMVLLGMIISATIGIPLVMASTGAVLLLMTTRCISIEEARRGIKWNVLILVGSAFAFGSALENTGVAEYLARIILPLVDSNQHTLIAGIMVVTMLTTEMITNNAAVLLIFPIAAQIAALAGFDSSEALRAVAVAVIIGASCSFLTPIGYQTNTIIYGPGGYKFSDYFRAGWGMSLIMLIIGSTFIPLLWPFG